MSGPPPQRPHPSSSQMVSGPHPTSVAPHVTNRPPMGATPYGSSHPMSRPPQPQQQQQHTHTMGSMYPPAPSPSPRPGMPGSTVSMQQGNAPPSAYPYHHPHSSAMRSSNGGQRHHPGANSMPPPQHPYHPSMGYMPQSHPPNHTNPPAVGVPPHGPSIPPSAPHMHGPYHPPHVPTRPGNNHPSSSTHSQSPTDLNRTQSALNGTWHSNSHLDHRKKMIEEM